MIGLPPAESRIIVVHENPRPESACNYFTADPALAIVSDVDIESSRDSSEIEDVDDTNLDLRRTPSIIMGPIDISDLHRRCDAGDESKSHDSTEDYTTDELLIAASSDNSHQSTIGRVPVQRLKALVDTNLIGSSST